jgi:hypothetical protein
MRDGDVAAKAVDPETTTEKRRRKKLEKDERQRRNKGGASAARSYAQPVPNQHPEPAPELQRASPAALQGVAAKVPLLQTFYNM